MEHKFVPKNKENEQKLRAYAAKWLAYFETHSKKDCFDNYLRGPESSERYFELGLEMDIFESLNNSYKKKHHLKNIGEVPFETLVDDTDNPWILGNALFSCWRRIMHWSNDSFENFSKETFIHLFRKIATP